MTIMDEYKNFDIPSKKIIVADLDGTLAESKSDMDKEMSDIIVKLLEYKAFAVISGGAYSQFQKQFVKNLSCPENLISRLYLFPTCATTFYMYKKGVWERVYSEDLSSDEKRRAFNAFEVAFKKANFKKPEVLYGELIEDRGTQVTFSAFGQAAPLELKKGWDPDGSKRSVIAKYMSELIPDLEIRIGGTTSIDVTKKGIDKAYGIKKIGEHLNYKTSDMLFVGDALFKGGNDYPVKEAGVDCISVTGPSETKRLFAEIIRISSVGNRSHTRSLLE